MDRIDSRPAHPPEPASDGAASPSSLPMANLPMDRLDFEPVPLRYRTDGLTPAKQRAYVEALADCGVAREAAARIGVSEQSINRVRRRSDARSFDDACEAAQMFGARRLRSIAFERAVEGTLKGHYYRGERVGEERVFDNRLLIFLLGKTEHLLQPSAEVRAICDHWEPCMEALEQGRKPPDLAAEAEAEALGDFELWRTDDGEWRTSFPPPARFEGYEEGVWDGMSWYCRSLTERELAAIDADAAEERVTASARRDRFFGFAGDEVSSPLEAEPYEPSEPSGEEVDLGPMEYKSLFPPAPVAMTRIQAEARRRGGASRFMPIPSLPPAAAGDNMGLASPNEHRKLRPLRASAPPREPNSGGRTFPHVRALPR